MKKLIFISSFIFITNLTFAQSEDEKAIKAVIMQLFAGIQKHDSTLLKNTFHSSARIQTINFNQKTELIVLKTETDINNFIKQICHNSVNISLKEIPKSFEIRTDNQLATAWTPYEFYRNDQISHCGVDSFQLYKTNNEWKILSLIYTIRKCE